MKAAPPPQARLPHGLRDVRAGEIHAAAAMTHRLAEVCAAWGFMALETPILEYADALGKFLPDAERPNAGVFALQDDDEKWLALRYDLTAPLARHVAAHYDELPKPFRRFQHGFVFRNEKPDPGRYRQFLQFDADVVGAPVPFADAELFALAAACMEALGLEGNYRLRISNRKLLDGLLECIGIAPEDSAAGGQRLAVLRAMDKLERLGIAAVEELLGAGRRDASGDVTAGAGLAPEAAKRVVDFVASAEGSGNDAVLSEMEKAVSGSARGQEGSAELRALIGWMEDFGVAAESIRIDPSIVRGLEYYTGPIFEIDLGGADPRLARFGAVGGGGRYDDLIARFGKREIPATGFSIGISRLQAGLEAIGKLGMETESGLQVVVLMPNSADKSAAATWIRQMRAAGLRAEVYLGGGGLRAQMRYADRRNARIAVICGEQERKRGEVTLRNLVLGKKLSADMQDHAAWKEGGKAQISVPVDALLPRIQEMLRNETP